MTRSLEPGMLIGGVIDDQLDHDLQAACMRLAQELTKVLHGAVVRMHAQVVGDVVAVVAQRRREERQQPEAGDTQILDVIELAQ